VPLATQGPVRPGRPTLQMFADARREDGTLLSASVPTLTASLPVVTGPTLIGENEPHFDA